MLYKGKCYTKVKRTVSKRLTKSSYLGDGCSLSFASVLILYILIAASICSSVRFTVPK